MENHVFILHEKVPVQRPGLQEIAGTYIPAHQVRQFQPLGFSENLMPISILAVFRGGLQNAHLPKYWTFAIFSELSNIAVNGNRHTVFHPSGENGAMLKPKKYEKK